MHPDAQAATSAQGAVTGEDLAVAFERRPRAILAADVVGYTRLMEAAESETHQQFRRLRVDVIDPTIIAHRGDVVKNTGDGYIAVFETPLDAARCALDLQTEVANQQAAKPADRRIAFRMGLHWDPIIFDLNDVYGHGVNTAARLQEVAPGGGVVISSTLRSALGDAAGLAADDLGLLRLKNLSRPVHAYRLHSEGSSVSRLPGVRGMHSARTALPAVAILPFQSTMSEPDDDYFAEGFVEDIITSLSALRDLLVVSRGSSLAFRGRRKIDPMEVGEKLGVQYVVAGRVAKSQQRIRIWAELTDVATASILWAEKYELSLDEIFQLQDDIALKVVGQIAGRVQQAEVKRALRKPPQSASAYDLLLRALDALYTLDLEKFSSAKPLLERAIEEDPDYAAPFAFASHWHMFKVAEGWSHDSDADAKEVMRLADCAIERDACNALAFALQGQAKGMFFKDYDLAIDYVDQAIRIAPSNSWAWTFSSGPYGFAGNAAEAIARAERAVRLSPIDPHAFFKICMLGQNHYLNGSYEDAVRWSRKSLSLNPRFGNAARVLAASLVALGRPEEARQVAEHHKQVLPRFRVSDYAKRCPFQPEAASLYVRRLQDAGIPD